MFGKYIKVISPPHPPPPHAVCQNQNIKRAPFYFTVIPSRIAIWHVSVFAFSFPWRMVPFSFLNYKGCRYKLQALVFVASVLFVLQLPLIFHPSQNPGLAPVESVGDPRLGRIWTKTKELELSVPKFKVHKLWTMIVKWMLQSSFLYWYFYLENLFSNRILVVKCTTLIWGCSLSKCEI